MRTKADIIYRDILNNIQLFGDKISTRNNDTFSSITLPRITFTETPLITWRKTAWKKAIEEMEWFMSGEDECPKNLLSWWEGQLDEDNCLMFGYPHQMRHFGQAEKEMILSGKQTGFDQIKFLLEEIKNHPNSRRLLLSIWHPEDMMGITKYNENPNTPTCCHSIVVQFFVRNNKLWMTSYQRSADMLLGVPHNWIQSWAMLLYFAYHCNLEIGGMNWDFGDAHIYMEESHLAVVDVILKDKYEEISTTPVLRYQPKEIELDWAGVPVFKHTDFNIVGEIPESVIKLRPKLL